jgi:hypothetical protein
MMRKKMWMLIALAIAFLSVSIAYTLVNAQSDPWECQSEVAPKISEEEAIAIATPIAEDYAQKNGYKIISIEAKHLIGVDFPNGVRKEFPVWVVSFLFKEEKTGIYGYEVSVLSDTGEIYNHEPLWNSVSGESAVSLLTVAYVAAPVCVGAVIAGVGIYKLRRKRPECN